MQTRKECEQQSRRHKRERSGKACRTAKACHTQLQQHQHRRYHNRSHKSVIMCLSFREHMLHHSQQVCLILVKINEGKQYEQ